MVRMASNGGGCSGSLLCFVSKGYLSKLSHIFWSRPSTARIATKACSLSENDSAYPNTVSQHCIPYWSALFLIFLTLPAHLRKLARRGTKATTRCNIVFLSTARLHLGLRRVKVFCGCLRQLFTGIFSGSCVGLCK